MSISSHEKAYRAFQQFKAGESYRGAARLADSGQFENAIWVAFVAGLQAQDDKAEQHAGRILQDNKNSRLGALWRALRMRLWPQDSRPSRVSPPRAGLAWRIE